MNFQRARYIDSGVSCKEAAWASAHALGPIPPCWECSIETRGGRAWTDHAVVVCVARNDRKEVIEKGIFDIWKRRPALEDPAHWFYKEYKEPKGNAMDTNVDHLKCEEHSDESLQAAEDAYQNQRFALIDHLMSLDGCSGDAQPVPPVVVPNLPIAPPSANNNGQMY